MMAWVSYLTPRYTRAQCLPRSDKQKVSEIILPLYVQKRVEADIDEVTAKENFTWNSRLIKQKCQQLRDVNAAASDMLSRVSHMYKAWDTVTVEKNTMTTRFLDSTVSMDTTACLKGSGWMNLVII